MALLNELLIKTIEILQIIIDHLILPITKTNCTLPTTFPIG